jgi:hypothetical protein
MCPLRILPSSQAGGSTSWGLNQSPSSTKEGHSKASTRQQNEGTHNNGNT